MIDFRYHLVSLIAVFLAVALGIVIGTTQLNGPLTDNLQGQVIALQEDKRALEDQTQSLQTQLADGGSFEEAVGPSLVAGSLADRSVVLVVDAADDVTPDVLEGLTALLGNAGASVTGTIRLTERYGDPATDTQLQSYLTGPGMPPGTPSTVTDDVSMLLATRLADVLMVPAGTGSTAPDATATATVLAGLEELDVLSRDTTSVSPADFAVLVTSGALTGGQAGDRTTALVELAAALDARGSGAVVAGDRASDGDGGLVAAVRDDATVAGSVSTVDNVSSAAGRISTVLALVAESRGISGEYGIGRDSQPVPQLPS